MKINLSEREKWLLFAGLAAIVLFIAAQSFYFPIFEKIMPANAELASSKEMIRTSEQKLRTLEKLEILPLENLRANKSKEQQIIEALKYIAKASQDLKIDIIMIKPRQEEKTVNLVKVVFLEVNLIGAYNDLYKLILTLEKLPILILVDSVNMQRGDIHKVNANMVLSVYY